MVCHCSDPVHRTMHEGDHRVRTRTKTPPGLRVANDTGPRSDAARSRACADMHAPGPERPQRWQMSELCCDPSCQSGHSLFPPATRRIDRRPLRSHRIASSVVLVIAPRAGYGATSSAALRMMFARHRCEWHRLHPIKRDDPRRNDPGPPFPSRFVVAVPVSSA